jgi:hypothetical protein
LVGGSIGGWTVAEMNVYRGAHPADVWDVEVVAGTPRLRATARLSLAG